MTFYDQPFKGSDYGWMMGYFVGTRTLPYSKVVHACVCDSPESEGRFKHELCNTYITRPHSEWNTRQAIYNKHGKYSDVTCKNCLKTMNRHKREPDWEV